MVLLRRLLTAMLAFALTQFGVTAVAPAHAHENGGHGVREIVLVENHADFEQDHHGSDADAGHHEDDHHDGVPEDMRAADGALPNSDDSSHGEHAHVHGCPQFAPLDAANMAYVPAMYGELAWPVALTPAARHSSSPPLRPPRFTL